MAKSIFGLFSTAARDEPLGNVRAIDRWAEDLPATDPIAAVEAMVRLLEESFATARALTVDRTLALMELDRLSLPLQAQLLAQYRLSVLSDEVRQNIWQVRNDLARCLAIAYEQIYEGSRNESTVGRFGEHLHGVFSRIFHYRCKQAQQGLIRYELWIPARWKFLHAAYKDASAQGLANLAFSLVQNPQPTENFSAEQEYLLLLLMQRINCGNMSVPQIEMTAQWMRELVPCLKLDKAPPQGDQYWLLNLAKTEGLHTTPSEAPDPELLYLDISPLRARLNTLMESLHKQLGPGSEVSGRGETRARLALARRLELSLLPKAPPQPRRGERRADQRAILVAEGWDEIPVLMRKARPWRAHDPVKYTYDGTVGTSALRGTEAPRKVSPLASDTLYPEQRGWQVMDSSDSGFRIESRTRTAAQLQIGDLLVMLLEGESRWRIGIVRRLKRRIAEHTELGAEVIAENAVLVMPEPVGNGNNALVYDIGAKPRVFHALYVPPQQRAQTAPVRSIVVPAGEYQPSRVFSIEMDGQSNQIRLVLLIEQTKDWVWTTFEAIGVWRERLRI